MSQNSKDMSQKLNLGTSLDTDLPGYQWTQTQKSKNGAMARETKDLSSLITSQRAATTYHSNPLSFSTSSSLAAT
jgi:hypothetical protein